MKFNIRTTLLLLLLVLFSVSACNKDYSNPYFSSDYSGSYRNIPYTSHFIKEFNRGTYYGSEIPAELRNLKYGRIEISFRYEGGGLSSFMPLFYYGSVNKNIADDFVEEPRFHLAIEIGHYNAIPLHVEYLFYTISTFREPQYCRDSWSPVITGKNYIFSIDKRPEGTILQLKAGDTIINSFPHAFFPDTSQMFFNEVSSYIENNKGDSLETVLMVGKGCVGFDKGIHDFHGQVNSVKIFAYSPTQSAPDYELKNIKNQLTENEELTFSIIDPTSGSDKLIQLNYEFQPYNFIGGEFIPAGEKQTFQTNLLKNSESTDFVLKKEHSGFYKVSLQTFSPEGIILKSTRTPLEIWVYPKEWYFPYY